MALISSGQITITDLNDPIQQGMAPTNPVEGLLWLDTSVSPAEQKRYSGTEWELVNDVQIGGRNLLLESEDERTAARNTSNSSFDYGYSPLLKELEEDTFTFSFEARADVEGMSVDFYFRDASTLISQSVYTKLTLNYERYVQPVVLKSGYTVNDIVYCRFRLNGGTGNVYVQRAMLERGNRATDWTAAPEDEEEKLEQKLATVHALISTTSDSIRQEVQANYASVDDMSEVQKQQTTLSEQTEDNFTWTVTQVNAMQEDLQAGLEATEEQMALLRTYMTFSSSGLIIGKTGNPFTFRVINDRLSFYMNDTEVAYLSNNKLYVTQAEILTRLQIGHFAFEPQTNGNLSVIYTG